MESEDSTDGRQGELMTETETQVIDWLAHGELGASSRCMAMWLGFGKAMVAGLNKEDCR